MKKERLHDSIIILNLDRINYNNKQRKISNAKNSRWWCTILAAAKFRDVHRLKGLHSCTYLSISALLVEDKAEPVSSVSILFREHERMERWLHRMFLCSKFQATR